LQIVAAVAERDGELLMVEQAGPGEDPVWSIPGGRVEDGEFVTEAVVREVREETGLTVRALGPLAFVAQVDERREAWFATVWTWRIEAADGELGAQDPDRYVRQAAWVPLDEALARLEAIRWHRLTWSYLRGELEPGALWLRRVQPDGSEELQGPFAA
jgi:8-oxo-dGTP diphosphatase